jgi:cytochrome c oxidase cbb3-type subunit 3
MNTPPNPPPDDALRPHSYDGIQEYDKRLPNWWLYTLYATIVFWVGYWSYYEWFRVGATGPQSVAAAMARIDADRLAATAAAKLDDASLWQMSRNAAFIAAGRATFDTTCAACHFTSLRGKAENPAAIGPDLTDTLWIHGGTPLEIHALITNGVLAKGMPTWGPVLGGKKITEVTAYILSHHKEGEPILIDPAAAAPK